MNSIVFLIVLTLASTSGSWTARYHEMPSMEICQECVRNAQVHIPNGGDAEAAIAMYCAKDKGKIR